MYRITLIINIVALLTAGCIPQRTYTAREPLGHNEMIELTLAGKGKAIVDWGDSPTPDTFKMRKVPFILSNMENDARWMIYHLYHTPGEKTVTVSGRLTGVKVEKKEVLLLDIVPDNVHLPDEATQTGTDTRTDIETINFPDAQSAIVEELRNLYKDVASRNPEYMPVVDPNETMEYMGFSIPIVGYQRDQSRQLTVAIIPNEYTHLFVRYNGGSLSNVIEGSSRVRNGIYDGFWNNWYIYTNYKWEPRRTHIYIDAPWKGTNAVEKDTDDIEIMVETE